MKSGLLRKTLAVVLMLQILLGTVPVQIFADDGDVPDEVTSAQSHSEEQPAEGSVSDGEDNGDQEADITPEVSPEQPTENTQADNTGAGEEANSQENGNPPDAASQENISQGEAEENKTEQPAKGTEEQTVQDTEGPVLLGSGNDAAPLLGAGNTCPAGDYVLGFQMYGNDDTTDYYEEHIRILDSDGEQIGSVLTFNAFNGTGDLWERKTISLTLDRKPATIEVNVSYGPKGNPGPIQLHYTAPFETDYVGKDASAIRPDNGEEVTFCHYDIQCVNYGTPIWYVDQYGNTHVKTDYETPGLDDKVGKEYWLPIRDSGRTQVLVVTGDTNIVLYDDVSYKCTGIFISPNSSLTIWGQKNGTGKLKTTGQTPGSETVLEQYHGDPGIEVWDDATLVINGGTIVAKG